MHVGHEATTKPVLHRLDFLCIAAPRSGSTWLWSTLRRHPEIWLPPRKELHWFDSSYRYPAARYLMGGSVWGRLFGLQEHNLDFKVRFGSDMLKAAQAGDREAMRWLLRYYLRTFDDADYLRLFEAREGVLNGEITPSYGILDIDDIRRVHAVAPDAKILLLLRNPIDRAWSALKYRRARKRSDASIDSLEDVKERLMSRGQLMRGDYKATLDRWQSVYPAESFVISFHDDIVQRPRWMLRELLNRLSVDDVDFSFGHEAEAKVNPSTDEQVPPEIAAFLAAHYLPMLRELTHLGGHVAAWIDAAEQALAADPAAGRAHAT